MACASLLVFLMRTSAQLVLLYSPVRIIIPGQIGGRSVKWLSKIEGAVPTSTNGQCRSALTCQMP